MDLFHRKFMISAMTFNFDIVNFPFSDGNLPRRASYGVFISQLIRFSMMCNHFTLFIARNKGLSPPVIYINDRSKAIRLLWFLLFYVLVMIFVPFALPFALPDHRLLVPF